LPSIQDSGDIVTLILDYEGLITPVTRLRRSQGCGWMPFLLKVPGLGSVRSILPVSLVIELLFNDIFV